MDRQIVYAGSIPLDTDLLLIQRHVMASIGALARAVLGDAPLVDGMACSPGAPPYSVSVGPGNCMALVPTDGAAFGALPADPTLLVKVASSPAVTVLQLGPPATSDQVICWLVQASIAGSDAGPLALPYWNAANPRVPYSGPGNSGAAQNTQRVVRVALSCKASSPQPYPFGTAPDPDPGCFGLYAVTTFAGKPGIEAADIVPVWNAPTLRFTLPQLPPGHTQQALFGASGNWRAPAGVRQARVRVVGGGGGGGGGATGYSGGGGGGGGYAEQLIGLRPGQLYDIVVGVGGGGGGAGSFGGVGGDSGFAGLVQATGGLGGGSANPDSHGGGPGHGVAGGLLQSGGYGGDGAMVPDIPGGNGGASAFGGGGRGANGGGVPAVGLASGSGGGGGYGVLAAGGPGANGLVVIEF